MKGFDKKETMKQKGSETQLFILSRFAAFFIGTYFSLIFSIPLIL